MHFSKNVRLHAKLGPIGSHGRRLVGRVAPQNVATECAGLGGIAPVFTAPVSLNVATASGLVSVHRVVLIASGSKWHSFGSPIGHDKDRVVLFAASARPFNAHKTRLT